MFYGFILKGGSIERTLGIRDLPSWKALVKVVNMSQPWFSHL